MTDGDCVSDDRMQSSVTTSASSSRDSMRADDMMASIIMTPLDSLSNSNPSSASPPGAITVTGMVGLDGDCIMFDLGVRVDNQSIELNNG